MTVGQMTEGPFERQAYRRILWSEADMPRWFGCAALIGLSACGPQTALPAPPGDTQVAIEEAARRAGVPAPILLAVAWTQSRLSMNQGVRSPDGGVGLFHLLDREGAPGSLSIERAARLTGLSVELISTQAGANALGYAVLLREQADKVFGQYQDLDEHRLGDWFEVLMLASGFEDAKAADSFATDVFRVLRDGAVAAADDGSVVRLSPQAFSLEGRAVWGQVEQGLSGEYCPGGSCVKYVAASTRNYTAGRQQKIDHVVIHDMEGTYAGAISWFQNPAAGASAHYDLRSSDGEITQQIRHADTAWHAGNWDLNSRSIGIEHEGFAAEGSRWYTEAMYKSSAALVRFLADKYSFPKDRSHIIGHYEVPDPNHSGWYGGANHHHDPCHTWSGSPTWHNTAGCDWDWNHYMELVTGSAPPPASTGTLTGFVGDHCCGTSASSRKPLPGATVALVGTSKSTKTDAQGMYSFTLAGGTYTPRASLAGYATADHGSLGGGVSAAVDVSPSATAWGSILLEKVAVVTAPRIAIAAPANGATVTSTPIAVRGTIDDKSVDAVKVNGASAAAANGAFSVQLALTPGVNTITVTATNAAGTGSATATVTYKVPTPPPAAKGSVAGDVTSQADAAALAAVTVAVDGSAASAQTDAQGHYRLDLDPGSYTLTFTKAGFKGGSRPVAIASAQVASLDVELEAVELPDPTGVIGTLTIVTPKEGIETGEDAVLVSGKVELTGFAALTVNGAAAAVSADGSFAQPFKLVEGANEITVRAADKDGRSLEAKVHVVYTPPAPPIQSLADSGCQSGPAGFSALVSAALALGLRRRRSRLRKSCAS